MFPATRHGAETGSLDASPPMPCDRANGSREVIGHNTPTAKRIVGSIKTGAMGERYGDPSEASEDMDADDHPLPASPPGKSGP